MLPSDLMCGPLMPRASPSKCTQHADWVRVWVAGSQQRRQHSPAVIMMLPLGLCGILVPPALAGASRRTAPSRTRGA